MGGCAVTIHEAVLSPARQILLTVMMLLLSAQLILIFAAFRDGRSGRVKLLYIFLFAAAFPFFYLPLVDICRDLYIRSGPDARPAAAPVAFCALPVITMVFFEILYGLVLTAAFLDLLRYRRSHLTHESIKETMDLLPAGIAFGKPDGTVVFSNLTMNSLSRSLTGKRLTDLSVFNNCLPKEDGTPGTLPVKDAVWQLYRETLELDDGKYTQFTATEITKQAAITKELEEKNAKLRELHMRLDIYNKQADRIVIAQELLTARMAVHSEAGNVLLESRRYLNDPASFDEEKLLQALRNTNTYLLREYDEDDSAGDPLTDAMEMAEAIGVDVVITGLIPAEDPCRRILAAAIGECATNTVKHGGGDRLSVNVQNTESGFLMILQGNGTPPAAAVRETGGLLTLRTLVEKAGGEMQTVTAPEFQIRILLPGENRILRAAERSGA